MSTQLAYTVAQNVVGMYRDPDTSSEMVSQAIFGDTVQSLAAEGRFTYVRTADHYEAWILTRWLSPHDDAVDYVHTTIAPLFATVVSEPEHSAEIVTRLTVGSRVILGRERVRGDYVPLRMPGGLTAYTHSGNISLTFERGPEEFSLAGAVGGRAMAVEALGEHLTMAARQFIGTPYLWGGTTPFGLDCSGFTQLVYRINGIQLLRDAHLQIDDRRFGAVHSDGGLDNSALAPGDLLFFGKTDHKITHVGMALGDATFIHSAGSGRGVAISSCGDPEFNSTFAGARRLLPDSNLAVEAA